MLTGWVARRRDYGQLIFIDLRDRYGVTQVVFDPERTPESAAAHAVAAEARLEYVLRVEGVVAKRLAGKENPALRTGADRGGGAVRRGAQSRRRCRRSPSTTASRWTRRCACATATWTCGARRMRAKVELRHRAVKFIRDYMDARGFVEVETPILTKSTPEGARDYLVPSRLYPGEFYALPQAPQQFKQLLMVAGIDRYFQIARCFRDEDLRADRQPEFTQLDVEMSFVDRAGHHGADRGDADRADPARRPRSASSRRPSRTSPSPSAWSSTAPTSPTCASACRCATVSELVAGSGFQVFQGALESGGVVKGIRVPGLGGRHAARSWTS